MTQEEINKAAEEYAAQNDGIYPSPVFRFVVKRAFNDGAEYALSHQWRDPKVELPKREGYGYLVCYCRHDNSIKYLYEAEYRNGKFFDDNNDYLESIDYWMELPQPPKTEEK